MSCGSDRAVRLSRLIGPIAAACLFTGVFCLSNVESARAEEASRFLPKDGTWVRYHAIFEKPNGAKAALSVTMSLVGTVAVDGKRCRWVEVKTEQEDGDHQKSFVFKRLVLEHDLLESDPTKPFKNVVRTWERGPDGSISDRPDRATWSELFLWTPGALRGLAKSGNAKDIPFKSRRLKSAQEWTGTSEARGKMSPTRTETTFTVWLHPDLPLGFAEASMQVNVFLEDKKIGKQLTTYSIEDSGTGATTELPDNN
jgi:hypothetical protein